jgi:microcystin-dependent protein
MNRIDFSFTGGFPLTQDTLDFMQAAYLDGLGAIAGLLGDKVIISGCTTNNGVVSAGIVSVNNEILPTSGGAATSTVFINSAPQTAVFEDGQHQEVYFRKSLVFGVGAPSWAWSAFRRLSKIVDMASTLVPAGAIMLWYGEANTVPAGWVLCDGTNGTPDMRGRFALGEGNGYNLGSADGAATVTLTASQMPSHTHPVTDPGHEHYLNFNHKNPSGSSGHQAPQEWNTNAQNYKVRSAKTGISLGYTGGGQPHSNMPPFRVLNYIMKKS